MASESVFARVQNADAMSPAVDEDDALAAVQELAWEHRVLEGHMIAALRPKCTTLDELNSQQILCLRAGADLLRRVLAGKEPAPPRALDDPVKLACHMMQSTRAINQIARAVGKSGAASLANKLVFEASRVRSLDVRPTIAKRKSSVSALKQTAACLGEVELGGP